MTSQKSAVFLRKTALFLLAIVDKKVYYKAGYYAIDELADRK